MLENSSHPSSSMTWRVVRVCLGTDLPREQVEPATIRPSSWSFSLVKDEQRKFRFIEHGLQPV